MIMKAIVSIACGIFCTLLLTMFGAGLISSHLTPTYYTQLPIVLIISTPGTLVAGLIFKKKGWLVGALTAIITELIYMIFLWIFLKNTISPSAIQTLRIYYNVGKEAQLYLSGGLFVFAGMLMGLLGEIIGKGKKINNN